MSDPEAPLGIPFQQYWDDQEYLAGLRADVDAAVEHGLSIAVDKRVITEAVMSMVFKTVKLHTWCDRTGCREPYCPPNQYTFHIRTYPRRFAPEVEEEQPNE